MNGILYGPQTVGQASGLAFNPLQPHCGQASRLALRDYEHAPYKRWWKVFRSPGPGLWSCSIRSSRSRSRRRSWAGGRGQGGRISPGSLCTSGSRKSCSRPSARPPAKPAFADLMPRFKGGSTPDDEIPGAPNPSGADGIAAHLLGDAQPLRRSKTSGRSPNFSRSGSWRSLMCCASSPGMSRTIRGRRILR